MTSGKYLLHIFTDGSSYSNPRTGGIGVRLIFIDKSGNEIIPDPFPYSGYKGANISQMELKACIEALKEAMDHELFSEVEKVVIHTDSLYVKDNYKKAMFQWSNNGWIKNDGGLVQNADLWKEFIKCIRKTRKAGKWFGDIVWVKGHAKNEHNKAADKLAKQSAKAPSNKRITYVDVRRKLSSESVAIGSVRLYGQRISIRIITSEYLKVQKIWKYKYEVVSKKSEYCRKIDFIYGDEVLRTGHSYFVSANMRNGLPIISKLIKELTK